MSADIECNITGTSNFVYHSTSQEELSYRRVGCLTKLTSQAHFVTPSGVACCVCVGVRLPGDELQRDAGCGDQKS